MCNFSDYSETFCPESKSLKAESSKTVCSYVRDDNWVATCIDRKTCMILLNTVTVDSRMAISVIFQSRLRITGLKINTKDDVDEFSQKLHA